MARAWRARVARGQAAADVGVGAPGAERRTRRRAIRHDLRPASAAHHARILAVRIELDEHEPRARRTAGSRARGYIDGLKFPADPLLVEGGRAARHWCQKARPLVHRRGQDAVHHACAREPAERAGHEGGRENGGEAELGARGALRRDGSFSSIGASHSTPNVAPSGSIEADGENLVLERRTTAASGGRPDSWRTSCILHVGLTVVSRRTACWRVTRSWI